MITPRVLAAQGLPQAPADASLLAAGGQAMRAGDFKAAAAAYSEAVRTHPGFAKGYMNLGLAQEQAGQLAESADSLRKALALQPALRGANLFLGIVEYRLNQLPAAEEALLREVRIDPQSAKAFMWLGVCQLNRGKAEAATATLDKAYALDPKDVDILYHRGRAYMLVAKRSYDAMYRLNINSVRVYQVLGEAAAEASQTADAITQFQQAVKAAPQQPGIHEELADQYWVAGRKEEAIAAYREEIVIDPHSATSQYKLGSLLVREDRAAEGVDLLRTALRNDPTLIDAHYYLAGGLAALNRDDDAIREYLAAISPDPKNDRVISAYYQLSRLYHKLNRGTEAQEALTSYLHAKAALQQRQANNAVQMAGLRTELPVEDPERAALSGGVNKNLPVSESTR